jgi:hypothetical protein
MKTFGNLPLGGVNKWSAQQHSIMMTWKAFSTLTHF